MDNDFTHSDAVEFLRWVGKAARVAGLLLLTLILSALFLGCAPADALENNPPADRLTVEYSAAVPQVRIVADSLNGVTCYVVNASGISCMYTGTPDSSEASWD